jgi:predicted CXXCH cytochrome family protein
MHNSQGGAPMTFDASATPNDNLTRGDCYGCHAQAGGTPTVALTTDVIPQVLHTGANDLAGGNFAYITGAKGAGGDDRGHNIGDLTGTDSVLSSAPGVFRAVHGGVINTSRMACTSVPGVSIGCHGYRYPDDTVLPLGVTGSHHSNVDGQLAAPTAPGNSYRFLMNVMGFESDDWEENPTSADHNEYYARTTPIRLGGSCSGASGCHNTPEGIMPPEGTMSQFCATCHGNYHTLSVGGVTEGVGDDAISPFVRHPTDLSLPGTGEYAAYTVYSVEAPVARTAGVPAASGSTVIPGTDAVMCLSCHRAHASNYPDMLRWDYTNMIAGSGNTGGCFTCHSTKD